MLGMMVLLSVRVRSFSTTRGNRNVFLLQKRSLSLLQRPSTSVAEVEPEATDRENKTTPSKEKTDASATSRRQLWLDLRGTSLFPHEALGFLQQVFSRESMDTEDLEDKSDPQLIRNQIDRILVSEDIFLKVQSSKNPDLDLLHAVKDDLIRTNRETGQSFPIGKILTCDDESSLDPLLALDTVSQGGWVVIDSDAETNEESIAINKEQQVTSLLQFLSSASTPSLSSGPGTLFLPGLRVDNILASQLRGGIAISCPTKTFLMQMATALQQFRCNDMLTTTTDSGIMLPTGKMNPRVVNSPALQTALVLPFDVQLWKTALDLLQVEDDQELL
jgi:hypothetical protein